MQSLDGTGTGEQIYLATEHGPGIPGMEMHLLAGPRRRAFGKEGHMRTWLNLFPWEGTPQLMAYLQGYT